MTSKPLFFLLALFAVTTLTALPLSAQTYDDSLILDAPFREDIKTLPLSTALDLVLQAQLNNADARYVLAKAAHAGDSTHIPVLKQIAQAYAQVVSAYSYQALYAALQLGEPVDYFINLGLQEATSRPFFAHHAIKVAAMRPDSTGYQQILPLAQGSWVQSGFSAYEGVLRLKAAYAQMPLQEEIERSLANLQGTFRLPIAGGLSHRPVGPVFAAGDLEPSAVWAREHLAEIAANHPAEVSAAIDDFVLLKAGQFPTAVQDMYRDHLYHYAGLDPNAPPPPPIPPCPATLALIDFLSHPPYALFVDVYNTSTTESADLSGCTLARFYFDHQTQERGAAFQVYQADTTLAPGDTLRLGPANPINPNFPPSGAPQYVSTFALLDLDTLSVGTEASALLPDVFITTIDFLTDTDVYAFDHTDEAVEPRYCQDYAGRLYPGGPASRACE